MKSKFESNKFQKGDYVQVVEGVHDARMPPGRRDGLVVQILGPRSDQVVVMFHNSAFLQFHKSQLSKLVKIE